MRLPAYGADLARARDRGLKPADMVFVTDHAVVGRVLRSWGGFFALQCMPLAAEWDFSPLYGLEVALVHQSDDVLGVLMRLDAAGAEIGAVLTVDQWWQSTRAFRDQRLQSA